MSALEQHFSPSELGKLWGLSDDTIRAWFRDEKGVLLIDRPEKMHKRGYTSMRIPASWRSQSTSSIPQNSRSDIPEPLVIPTV
jgi:hypothetical protein